MNRPASNTVNDLDDLAVQDLFGHFKKCVVFHFAAPQPSSEHARESLSVLESVLGAPDRLKLMTVDVQSG